MGRSLLILAALVAATLGCAPQERLPADDPHAELSCAACHRGARADLGRAAVPTSACTASGCHGDLGPARVALETVGFRHRHHGVDGDIVTSCAGCHTHDAGDEPLRASVDACALCHVAEIADRATQNCAMCHPNPAHVRLTSQGVPVSHASLAIRQIGCDRCHYDVSDPPTAVATTRCGQCHTRLEQVTAAGVGRDLHPIHAGVTCTGCHESETHHIRAMSSVVSLTCTDCHQSAHELDLRGGWPPPTTCVGCHQDIHWSQQQMVLGLVPDLEAPATKFLAGMSCRSCHVPPASGGAPVAAPIRGTAEGCAGCHGPDYTRVLDWWLSGIQQRQARAERFLDRARAVLAGAPQDTVARLLDNGAAMLHLVRTAGGHHNLELSDRMFRETIRQAQQAYRAAGRAAPPPPELGAPPHMGFCTFCHYAPDDPWDLRRMPAGVHEDMVRRQREAGERAAERDRDRAERERLERERVDRERQEQEQEQEQER
jgi:hypothetical protein